MTARADGPERPVKAIPTGIGFPTVSVAELMTESVWLPKFATYTIVPIVARALGLLPTIRVLGAAVRFAVLMTETVSLPPFATYNLSPMATMAEGRFPTGMGSPEAASVVVSTMETEPTAPLKPAFAT